MKDRIEIYLTVIYILKNSNIAIKCNTIYLYINNSLKLN